MSDYGVIILGGTGQVGSAVVKAFLNSPRCREVLLLSRRPTANSWGERVRVVTVDPENANFAQDVAALLQACAPRPMFAVSCVGVGSGSRKWSEQALIQLEVGTVGAFARGCQAAGVTNFGLLTAVGSSSKSKIRYARVMGLKEEAVKAIGFPHLAIFRPGIIAGNAHTPHWVAALGRFIPGPWGTVDQQAIARAFVGALERNEGSGIKILHNADMRRY